MKLWRLAEPHVRNYARAGRVGGTWQEGEPLRRSRPLRIEWLPGPITVGDFTWPGTDTDVAVTERIAKLLLEANVSGVTLDRVEIVTPSRGNQRLFQRITANMPGNQLWDLWPTHWTHIDQSRSTVRQVESGTTKSYEIVGAERIVSRWSGADGRMFYTRQPRDPRGGIYTQSSADIFRISEFPAWIFCTDTVEKLLRDRLATNVDFLEMGDVN